MGGLAENLSFNNCRPDLLDARLPHTDYFVVFVLLMDRVMSNTAMAVA